MRLKKTSLTLSLLALFLTFAAAAPAARARQTEIPLRSAQYKLARLAADQPADEAQFAIDQCGLVTVDIIATAGGVGTSIVTPGGQIITPAVVSTFGGSFESFEGSNDEDGPGVLPAASRGFHYIYTFAWQGAGTYRVRFDAPAGLNQETPVFTEVTTDSPIRAKLFATEPTLTLGRPAVLSAALFNGAAPVAGADVSVFVNAPSGAPINLTLRDDGGPADDAAGDGLYSGEFTPAAAGKYEALAVITGASNGVSFARASAADFLVVNPPSRLSGTVGDDGVDDDADGLFDRVVFQVGTQTATAGRYRAFVHLKTAGGKQLVGSSDADLAAGAGVLPVSVFADELRALGENGPYTVEFIELDQLGPAGASPCDRADVGTQTRAYLLTQFQRKPLILTGTTSDQGFDDNSNGKFDRLVVNVQVEVVFAGFYQWNMKLFDQSARQIEFAAGSGFLGSGLNNMSFTFDGSAIGQSGADGPFRLGDLVLLGTKSIVVADVGATQGYRSSQFENGRANADVTPPTLSVTLTPTDLWPANHNLTTVNANVQVSDDTDPGPRVTLVSVTSNEPDDGLGDGDTAGDIQGASTGTDDREFSLRAERSGMGTGRVYTIVYRATDAAGNMTEVTVHVNVPHSQGK